jgi:hypothetical protein
MHFQDFLAFCLHYSGSAEDYCPGHFYLYSAGLSLILPLVFITFLIFTFV